MKTRSLVTVLLAAVHVACVQRLDLSVSDAATRVDDAEACEVGATRPCFDAPMERAGVGQCRAGVERCAADGRWSNVCDGQVLPAREVCNLVDDDCNGEVDERSPYEPVTSEAGFATNVSLVAVNHFTRSPDDRARLGDQPFDSVLTWNSGVAAENCSDAMHFELFDAEGAHLTSTAVLRMPAQISPTVMLDERGVRAAAFVRDYVQPTCLPAIEVDVCPVVVASARSTTDRGRVWAGTHCNEGPIVAGEQFLLVRSQSEQDGVVTFDFDVINDAAASTHAGTLRFTSPDDGSEVTGLRGVRDGERIVWMLRGGEQRIAVLITGLRGVAMPDGHHGWTELPHPAGELTALAASADSLVMGFIENSDGLASRFVRLSLRDGRVEREWTVDGYGVTSLAPSRNGQDLYTCGSGFGLSLMRFSRDGRAEQAPIPLEGRFNRSGSCVVTATTRGALVAWAHDVDGIVRWTRVSCAPP